MSKINTEMKYSLNDIAIEATPIHLAKHDIYSRQQCANIYQTVINQKMLPLFTSPMTSIVSIDNYKTFQKYKINTIIPRSESLGDRLNLSQTTFVALSLKEAQTINMIPPEAHICIDLANGHMKCLVEVVQNIKKMHPDCEIMLGNVATPDIYFDYADMGVDYIRCSVGTGSRCITACNTGVFYPMASLIAEIDEQRKEYKLCHGPEAKCPKIIADGGMNNFDDIIKSLALGADFVMCGRLFAALEEAAGYTYVLKYKKYREYYGMASIQGQIDLGNTEMKVAEGIKKDVEIVSDLNKWTTEFKSYLASAMSYCDSISIDEFRPKINVISKNSFENIFIKK